jgi:hypothetical protein
VRRTLAVGLIVLGLSAGVASVAPEQGMLAAQPQSIVFRGEVEAADDLAGISYTRGRARCPRSP